MTLLAIRRRTVFYPVFKTPAASFDLEHTAQVEEHHSAAMPSTVHPGCVRSPGQQPLAAGVSNPWQTIVLLLAGVSHDLHTPLTRIRGDGDDGEGRLPCQVDQQRH